MSDRCPICTHYSHGECTSELSEKLGEIIDKKHRFAYRMAEVLREIEWSDGHWSVHTEGGGCPQCRNSRNQGHAADCALATVLAEWDAS